MHPSSKPDSHLASLLHPCAPITLNTNLPVLPSWKTSPRAETVHPAAAKTAPFSPESSYVLPLPLQADADPSDVAQFGGVTCDRGSCIAVECLDEEGYELVGSTCLLRGSQPELSPSSTTSPISALVPVYTSTHEQHRHALTSRPPTAIHISHRAQARIEPDAQVTIYLQYSGIDLTPETGSEDGIRMMDASAGETKNFKPLLERIREMETVRIVETDGK